MFTGIIEEVGRLLKAHSSGDGLALLVSAPALSAGLKPGESVAVNGVCLTVEAVREDGFEATAGPETLKRTGLDRLGKGARVNLERAVQAGGRFGGHFVQGHVDGTTRLLKRESTGRFMRLTFALPPEGASLVMEKGSIAIDGISLTVSRLGREDFSVDVIPYTADQTFLEGVRAGDVVNLEFDMLAKMVDRILGQSLQSRKGITPEFLAEHGMTGDGPNQR